MDQRDVHGATAWSQPRCAILIGCKQPRHPGCEPSGLVRRRDRYKNGTATGDQVVTPRDRPLSATSEKWWPGAESNHRHADFQSAALPTYSAYSPHHIRPTS